MKKIVLVSSVVGLLVLLYGGSLFLNPTLITQPEYGIKDQSSVTVALEPIPEIEIPVNDEVQELPVVIEESSVYKEEIYEDDSNYCEEEETEVETSIQPERGYSDNIPKGEEQQLIQPVNNPVEESKSDITIVECDPEKGEYRFYDEDGNLIKIEYFEPDYKITP